MKKLPRAQTIAICRAALQRMPLTKDERGWRIGKHYRWFRFHTIRAMAEAGEVIIEGNTARLA